MDKIKNTLVSNRYNIIKKIATGGMADVYLGYDSKLSRKVAIKILSTNYASDKNFVARFKREAQVLAKLNDPNIVSIYDWGEFNNSYFICMEYVEGQSLKEIIDKKGTVNPKIAANYAIQICSALEVAHKNNLIHRDIKPQNIMITPEGVVKVTDFGIAKSLVDDTTKTLNIIGTAHYISPEQAQGKTLDYRTDIYSLGIVIYEMLTSDVPFRGENSIDISLKHINEIPIKPSKLINNIPAKLEKIVMLCLEKDPSKRYKDIKTLKNDLQNFLDNSPLSIDDKINKGILAKNNPLGIKYLSKIKSKYPIKSKPQKIVNKANLKYHYIILYLLLALFLILFIIFGSNYLSLKNKLNMVLVPPLEGISVDTAEKILSTYSLTLNVKDSIPDASIQEGYIITQSPPPKTSIPINSSIEVIVSSGKEDKYVTVPNLIGLTLEEGTKILKNYNLKIGNISKTYSDTFDENVVIHQNPWSGEEVNPGGSIDLTVSLGEKTIIIPNVIGWDYLYASSQLESLGLVVKKTRITNTNYPPGTIIKVYPPAGSKVKQNSAVELLITTTEQLILVPDVVQMSLEQAITILESNNIGYEISYVKTDYSVQKDIVLGQDPKADSYFSPDSVVTLYVSH